MPFANVPASYLPPAGAPPALPASPRALSTGGGSGGGASRGLSPVASCGGGADGSGPMSSPTRRYAVNSEFGRSPLSGVGRRASSVISMHGPRSLGGAGSDAGSGSGVGSPVSHASQSHTRAMSPQRQPVQLRRLPSKAHSSIHLGSRPTSLSSAHSGSSRGGTGPNSPAGEPPRRGLDLERGSSSGDGSSGGGEGDTSELNPDADPFGNFSFTNYTTLSQVCVCGCVWGGGWKRQPEAIFEVQAATQTWLMSRLSWLSSFISCL
jgi:hypothetical protein